MKGLLKAGLKHRNVSYRDLAEKLGALGIHETERNIANKILLKPIAVPNWNVMMNLWRSPFLRA